MVTIRPAYRPEPGEVIPIETDAVKSIRSGCSDNGFITWLSGDEWIVSYRFDDGVYVDVAVLGKGKVPQLGPGTIETLRSMKMAGDANKGRLARQAVDIALKVLEANKQAERERIRNREEWAWTVEEEKAKLRFYAKKRGKTIKADNPALRPAKKGPV